MGSWKPGKSGQMCGLKVEEGIQAGKDKIDQLAGNNSLGHNFLTDSRVDFWKILDEPALDEYVNGISVIQWITEIAAYMHTKGCNTVSISNGYINGGVNPNPAAILPLLRDHLDNWSFHYYGGTSATFQQWIDECIAHHGPIPLENITVLFGITESALPGESRGVYYNDRFDLVLNSPLGGASPYMLLDIGGEGWGAVMADGTYYPFVTDQYKLFYKSSTPVTPSIAPAAIIIAGILISVLIVASK